MLEFLPCRTPTQWFEHAARNVDVLLVDHANCEKKAASTALAMLYRYTDDAALVQTLSKLAREELRHFEQVHAELVRRSIPYQPLSAARYAGALHKVIRTHEPARLTDMLLVGAVVEARSCERFLGLVEVLPDPLARFYARLCESEARHFTQYLTLAERSGADLSERVDAILTLEKELVSSPDAAFRFHSGLPVDHESELASAKHTS